MFLAVGKEFKILLRQISYWPALSVGYRNIHRNNIGVYAHDVIRRFRFGREDFARPLYRCGIDWLLRESSPTESDLA